MKNPSLSQQVIQTAIETAIGSPQLQNDLSEFCMSLDSDVGPAKSKKLHMRVLHLPPYKKKDTKNKHSLLLLKLFQLYSSIKESIKLRSHQTRLGPWDDIAPSFSMIISIMKIVDVDAEQDATTNETSETILRFLKMDETEWNRHFLRGRKTSKAPTGYEVCIFCTHPCVDSPPCNEETATSNQALIEEHSRLEVELQEFKEKRRPLPPVNAKGKELTKLSFPTLGKMKLRCHCHQQGRVAGCESQSTCHFKCINQLTGKKFPDGQCAYCNCKCHAMYHLEDVVKIKETLRKKKSGEKQPKAKKSAKNHADEWIARHNNAGRLARETTQEIFFGTKSGCGGFPTASAKSSEAYLDDVQDIAKATSMVQHKPNLPARTFIRDKVINPIMEDSQRHSIIKLGDELVDLQSHGRTAPSKKRITNNGLDADKVVVNLEHGSDIDDSSVSSMSVGLVTKKSTISSESSDDNHHVSSDSIQKLKRMKSRVGPYLHSQKRPSVMSEEERKDRRAAMKCINMYDAIIKEGETAASTKLDTIEIAITAAQNDPTILFSSQEYNECFMNIYGYDA